MKVISKFVMYAEYTKYTWWINLPNKNAINNNFFEIFKIRRQRNI